MVSIEKCPCLCVNGMFGTGKVEIKCVCNLAVSAGKQVTRGELGKNRPLMASVGKQGHQATVCWANYRKNKMATRLVLFLAKTDILNYKVSVVRLVLGSSID